jgi:hypothetical protein
LTGFVDRILRISTALKGFCLLLVNFRNKSTQGNPLNPFNPLILFPSPRGSSMTALTLHSRTMIDRQRHLEDRQSLTEEAAGRCSLAAGLLEHPKVVQRDRHIDVGASEQSPLDAQGSAVVTNRHTQPTPLVVQRPQIVQGDGDVVPE